jgi:hypothetical protein
MSHADSLTRVAAGSSITGQADDWISHFRKMVTPCADFLIRPIRSKVIDSMTLCLTFFSRAWRGTLALCCALVGCGKSPAQAGPAPSASAPAVAAERHPTAPLAQNPRDFGMLFRNEAANRPTGTIKAEDAIAAFRHDGIELNTVKQHLARPYGARYCVGAMSGTDVALSVCEYIDAQAAEAGAEVSRKILLANREIKINQATSLTVREVEKKPAADATSKKLFDSFAKLSTLSGI